jgi:hypothetical protein
MMAERTIASKLQIKPHMRVLVLQADSSDTAWLHELPEGVTVDSTPDGTYDAVVAFIPNRAAVATVAAQAVQHAKNEAPIWLCYPRKHGAFVPDFNRDVGWEPVYDLGYGPVSQVAIGERWSALRWRLEANIRRHSQSTLGPSGRKPSN